MASVSRGPSVSQFASVSYPPPGTINKGAGTSNGGGGSGGFTLLNDAGTQALTNDSGTTVLTGA